MKSSSARKPLLRLPASGNPGGVWWTILSVVLFGVSLTQPAFLFGAAGRSTGPAWELLLVGWRGVSCGYVEWLANPVLVISWIMSVSRYRAGSAVLALTACGLMVTFLCRSSLQLPGAGPGVAVVSYRAGYWLWVMSAALMVLGHGSALIKKGPTPMVAND
jgi:hypothetical protein